MVRAGEPPPNGCGSSMTRTSTPLLAASSSALITLRSLKIYISNQTDFFAALIASVMGCSPAFGSTKTLTPCTPGPVVQLLTHEGFELVGSEILMVHPASKMHSARATITRYLRDVASIVFCFDICCI